MMNKEIPITDFKPMTLGDFISHQLQGIEFYSGYDTATMLKEYDAYIKEFKSRVRHIKLKMIGL